MGPFSVTHMGNAVHPSPCCSHHDPPGAGGVLRCAGLQLDGGKEERPQVAAGPLLSSLPRLPAPARRQEDPVRRFHRHDRGREVQHQC
jgi:hypothetical protein